MGPRLYCLYPPEKKKKLAKQSLFRCPNPHTEKRANLERQRREDVASALMKLSQIRQHYSDLGRPR